ncbi:hypothetical protein FMUND_9938 [Fusarium mundagurra]|uniref:Uncharacterized protein n=1 Tax=Fusarium mundagurra TaxID=1567541 RepID=A0A8H5YE19_9HYPO|nr:hypothetical protein FMUND_9938 [Fusarium mundagurra]
MIPTGQEAKRHREPSEKPQQKVLQFGPLLKGQAGMRTVWAKGFARGAIQQQRPDKDQARSEEPIVNTHQRDWAPHKVTKALAAL